MKLLGKGEKPDWYEDVFTGLMEQGMRVLALAYRWVPDKQVGSARTEVCVGHMWCPLPPVPSVPHTPHTTGGRRP